MKAVLLCVLDHRTQYDSPIWACLSARGNMMPVVWYARPGVPLDPEVNRAAEWGEPSFAASVVADRDIWNGFSRLAETPAAVLVSGWRARRPWLATAAAWRRGIPVITLSDKTNNEPADKFPLRVAATVFHAVKARMYDGFITAGVLGDQYLRSVGVPPDRIGTGMYPVDGDWWRRRLVELEPEAQALKNAMPDGPIFLGVAKHSSREAPFALIDGFAAYCAQGRPGSLLLVGDGPLRNQLETHVAATGLAPRIRFCGYVPYTRLAAYYGAADVFVHVPLREPWGISVGEAMSCGLPVVASSSVGAGADLVIPGRTGFIVPPGDSGALAEALTKAVELAGRPGQPGRQLALAATMETNAAAASLETLVTRLAKGDVVGGYVPLSRVLKAELLNMWGRWSL